MNVEGSHTEAFLYLERLLPEVPRSEILAALGETEKISLIPQIFDVGYRVGAQFYQLEATAEEVLTQAVAVPVLELGESPRVLVPADEKQVLVLEGLSSRRVHRDTLPRSRTRFLIPSPRMTLAVLRSKTPVRRVLAYLLSERDLLRSLVVYAIFVEGLSLAAPLAVQVLINTVGFGLMSQQLFVIAALLLVGLAGAAALSVFQQVIVEHLSRRFFARTVMDYSERLPAIEPGKMKNPIHRFFEVASVDKAFFILGLDLIALVLQLLAATLLMSFYHSLLLSFTLFMAICSFLIVRLPFSLALRRSLAESKAKYELADFLLAGPGDETKRLHLFSVWEEARSAGFRVALGQQIGLQVLQVVLSVALLVMGGMLVIEGQLTLGQLVAAELIAGTALISLNKLGKQLPKIYDLITSFEKLGSFVDLPFRKVTSGFSVAPALPTTLGRDPSSGDPS
jgi:ABC-type bacteriocin/lantibiotic exporter with double-glycine peptidase domain